MFSGWSRLPAISGRTESILFKMRVVFLIPALRRNRGARILSSLIEKMSPGRLGRWAMSCSCSVDQVWGGTLNIFRHGDAARRAGADVVFATTDGVDSYGDVFGDGRRYSFIRWRDRRETDLCIVPDYMSRLIDDVHGPVVAYEQSPLQLNADFEFRRENVQIWTDSPFMRTLCEATFPGKAITIVPNVVDEALFPFIPQSARTPGLIFAFPRKNPEFISATRRCYAELGGSYWNFELIDALSITQLAARFREPQAFLASARNEGCALPPQEAMAAGIVVVGRTAGGANFCMQEGVTSLNAETPDAAARRLVELESAALRERLAAAGRSYISRFLPDAQPLDFWTSVWRHQIEPRCLPGLVVA